MFTEIAGSELEIAVHEFRERVRRELTLRGKPVIQNPGGIDREGENYEITTPSGLLSIVVMPPEEHPTKYIHAINIDRPEAPDATLRFNLSKNVDGSGRTGGLFGSNTQTGEVYLCSRAAITVYRQPLPAKYVLDYFRPSGSVVEIRARRRWYEGIKIAGLKSPELFDDLARFAKHIEALKEKYRSDSANRSR